jgi:hypothetical protein
MPLSSPTTCQFLYCTTFESDCCYVAADAILQTFISQSSFPRIHGTPRTTVFGRWNAPWRESSFDAQNWANNLFAAAFFASRSALWHILILTLHAGSDSDPHSSVRWVDFTGDAPCGSGNDGMEYGGGMNPPPSVLPIAEVHLNKWLLITGSKVTRGMSTWPICIIFYLSEQQLRQHGGKLKTKSLELARTSAFNCQN